MNPVNTAGSMPQIDLSGQTALVTGAGEGIGLAICRQFLEAGCRVVLNDVRPEEALRAARELQPIGECLAVPGDASSLSVVEDLVQRAVSEFGGLDILVANAAVTRIESFLKFSVKDFQDTIDLNLRGTFFLAQAAARQMEKSRTRGRIIITTSVVARRVVKGLSVYSMTKAGLETLVRFLAVELGPLGIRVNAIAPGATLTPRTRVEHPEYEEVWGAVNPLQRVAEPSDVAAATLFLASSLAEYVNGEILTVDGGWTASGVLPRDLG